MHWVKNADKARRVLYVQGRYADKKGRALALAEPEGAVARLLVPSVALPIDGPEARSSSRRRIDQFGFENALELIITYCRAAQQQGQLGLRYLGQGQIDGRATYVIERTLPYSGEGGRFPDRKLVVHLDKQWLIPVACHTYADDQKQQMLASYVFTQVQLNVGLTDQDFTPAANGM